MTKLYENIKMLCKANKISIAELERAAGFPENSIANWKQPRTWGKYLVEVADYFNVSTDFLLGRTSNPDFHKE